MNKIELKNKLMDSMMDTKRAKRIANVINIIDNDAFDAMYNELEKDNDLDYCFLTMDANITAIVDYLDDVTIEDIETQFNNYYNNNYLIASKDGRGFLFIEG